MISMGLRRPAATAVAALALLACGACSGGKAPAPSTTGRSVSGSSPSATAPASSTTSGPPSRASPSLGPVTIPTSYPATQTTFTLPSSYRDATQQEMVKAYVDFEAAYRHSMATAVLDPAVKDHSSAAALGVAMTSVTYLQTHKGTLLGPWSFAVDKVDNSADVGQLTVCGSGGRQVMDGKTTAFTGTTPLTVSMSRDRLDGTWKVVGYGGEEITPC